MRFTSLGRETPKKPKKANVTRCTCTPPAAGDVVRKIHAFNSRNMAEKKPKKKQNSKKTSRVSPSTPMGPFWVYWEEEGYIDGFAKVANGAGKQS